MSKEYKTFHLWNAESGTNIELYPQYDFVQRNYNNNKHQRTIGGFLNTYRYNKKGVAFDLSLTFVNSSDKSFIHDIWYNQTLACFTLNLSSSPQSVLCNIVNTTLPLNMYSPFQLDKWHGNLFLKSTDGNDIVDGAPFILDDPVYGLLDQSYNVLL